MVGRMKHLVPWALATLLGAAACTTEEPKPKLFVPASEASGPRIWVDAERRDGSVVLRVSGAELGEVFGWGTHVTHDAAAFDVSGAEVLGALGDDASATRIASAGPGDVAFGEARRGPSLGGVVVDEPTVLAEVRLADAKKATSVGLERAVVRRADGSWVGVALVGGQLDPEGSAP